MITLEYVLSFSMSIPDFQSIMLPLLELANDGKEHKLSETVEPLANYFNLTESERRELLPSGKQRRFDSNVRWADKHIKEAVLLIPTSRGKFQGRQAWFGCDLHPSKTLE
jgi:restriction system protein